MTKAINRNRWIYYTKLFAQLESQASTAQGDKLIESLTTLQERKNGLQNSLLQLENQLTGYGQEILLQQPSLPEKPSSPKKSQVTIIAGILAGFILLVWAFLRAALRAASDDPECASKLARIRKSFGFWMWIFRSPEAPPVRKAKLCRATKDPLFWAFFWAGLHSPVGRKVCYCSD